MRSVLMTASVLAIGLAGCGDDGGGGVSVGDSTSVAISAAEGGTVELGEATLTIPAGALAEDTTITVEVLDAGEQPDSENILGHVFDFGPDGTEFSMPVTIELGFSGDPPEGSTATIAFNEDGAWHELADSSVEGDTVTATTTHFTPFTVVVSAGGQSLGGCDPITPCACDVVGTWDYSAGCFTLPTETDPFPDCPEASGSATIDISGTVTFETDGTYSNSGTTTISITLRIPFSCLKDQIAMGKTCPDLNDGKFTYTEVDGACEGTQTTTDTDDGTGTYATSGSTLTFDGGDNSADCCVSGDSLEILITNTDGSQQGYTATRQ